MKRGDIRKGVGAAPCLLLTSGCSSAGVTLLHLRRPGKVTADGGAEGGGGNNDVFVCLSLFLCFVYVVFLRSGLPEPIG